MCPSAHLHGLTRDRPAPIHGDHRPLCQVGTPSDGASKCLVPNSAELSADLVRDISMLEARRLVLGSGYASSEVWIVLAKRAEAVGFTPRTWLIIRQSLETAYVEDRCCCILRACPGGGETVVVDPVVSPGGHGCSGRGIELERRPGKRCFAEVIHRGSTDRALAGPVLLLPLENNFIRNLDES